MRARAIVVKSTEKSEADKEAIQMTTIMRAAPTNASTRRAMSSPVLLREWGPGRVQAGAACCGACPVWTKGAVSR